MVAFALLHISCVAPTLKLGFLYQHSPASWLVESRSQFKLALREINAAGVLPVGTNLSYAEHDSQGLPLPAVQGAIQLLSDPEVVGLVGTGYSTALEAAATYASARRKPIISPGSTAVGFANKAAMPFLLRTCSSDAAQLEMAAATVAGFGWRHVAVIVSESIASDRLPYMRSAAQAHGITVRIEARIPDSEAAQYQRSQMHQALESVLRSGARILVSITRTVDQGELHAAARSLNLHNASFAWIGLEASYTQAMLDPSSATGSTPGYVRLTRRVEARTSTVEEYRQLFSAQATRYDQAIHGAYDSSSGAPFYDAAHEGHIFDTGNGPVGNGEPDSYGMYAYDTAWLYAHALANLTARGISPLDGESLLGAIMATRFEGVTGYVQLDPQTQDRGQAFELYNIKGIAAGAEPNSTLRIAQVQSSVASGTPEQAGEDIQWAGECQPHDGSKVDPFRSELTCGSSLCGQDESILGTHIELRVRLRNAWGDPVDIGPDFNVTIGSSDESTALATPQEANGRSDEVAFDIDFRGVGDVRVEVMLQRQCGRAEAFASTPLDLTVIRRFDFRAAVGLFGVGVVLIATMVICLRKLRKQGNSEDGDGVEDAEDVVGNSPQGGESARTAIRAALEAAIVLVAYLTLAGLTYSALEPSWSLTDAIYFAMATCSTVGYGDFSPGSPESRAFTVLMILLGIVFVFPVAGGAVSSLLFDPLTRHGRKLLNEKVCPAQESTEGDGNEAVKLTQPSHPIVFFLKNLTPSLLLTLVVQLVSAAVFVAIEGWGYGDAIYHCIVTATTVGYGDQAINTTAGKTWASVHMFFAVTLLAELITTLNSIDQARRQQLEVHERLKSRLDPTLVRRLMKRTKELRNEDHSYEVNVHDAEGIGLQEYLLSLLIETNVLDWSTLLPFIRQFRRFDVTQDGRLSEEDLTRMQGLSDKELKLVELKNAKASSSEDKRWNSSLQLVGVANATEGASTSDSRSREPDQPERTSDDAPVPDDPSHV